MFYEKIKSDLSLIDEKIKYLLAYTAYNPDVIVFDEIKGKIIGFTDFTDNNNVRVVTEDNTIIDVTPHQVKLLLKPIKEVSLNSVFDDDIDVRTFINEDFLKSWNELKPEFLSFGGIMTLIKYKYDVFGLIDKGLAVYYNTVFSKSDVL